MFQIQLINKIRNDILVCLSLLTRIPVGKIIINKKSIGDSCWAFSLCGLVISIISSVIFHFTLKIGFNEYTASIFFLVSNIFLSGALHEDGLADLADGMFVGKNLQGKLDIMNDSRIGVFGVLALIITFIIKFLAISQLTPELNSYLHLILIAMVSRYNMLFFLRFLEPLKKNGLGKGYKVEKNFTLLAGLFPILILLPFIYKSGLIILIFMFIICLILFVIISIIFRGQTGDICGASQQIGEVAGLLMLTLLI